MLNKDKTVEALVLYFLEHKNCECYKTFDDDVACEKCVAIAAIREHLPIHFELATEKRLRRKHRKEEATNGL